MDLSILYGEYRSCGFVLVAVTAGAKRPIGYQWNHLHNCVLPPDWAEIGGGVGLAHAFSDTVAIDLDKLAEAISMVQWGWGIDLMEFINAADAVWIVSGRDNRLKLLYRLPPGLIMPTVALTMPGGEHVLQFRCATKDGLTVQDVLPPTIHPDTGKPYEWGGAGDWHNLPALPGPLIDLWTDLAYPRRQRRAGSPGQAQGGSAGGIGAWIATNQGDDAGLEELEAEIRAMLEHLDPDMGRDDWYRVGMAIHGVSADLYHLWDDWSARGAKYRGTGDTGAVWASFKDPDTLLPGEAVTLGTMRRLAYLAGYRAKIDPEALYQAAGFAGSHSPGPAGESNQSAAPVQGLPTFEELLERAQGLNPTSGVREILAQAVNLTPTEQDRLLNEIRDKTTINKDALRRELRELAQVARASMTATQQATRPQFIHFSDQGAVLDHVDNLRALCAWRGVTIQFNEMTHDIEVWVPDMQWSVDDWRNQQLSWVRDLMVCWGMPYTRSMEHVRSIALQANYHPLGVMLDRTTWDGMSRWGRVKETIRTAHPAGRDLYLRKWLISAIAAVRGWGHGVPPRGVVVFSGEQAQGKTSWLKYLTPRGLFGEGLHLDPANKDSLKQAVSWWIVELGELDSTFSKADISRLKAHISKGQDELRLPYAPSESRWPRRTVYAGTVNKQEFLADQTGNTRFWPIETLDFDLDAMRAMWESGEILQLWKEVETWYTGGEQWWLSREQLRALEEHNEEFRERPAIEETLEYVYLWDAPQDQWKWKTSTEIKQDCELTVRGSGPGNQGPENTQFKEALKKLTGQPKALLTRRGGPTPARKWKVPPRRYEVIQGGRGEEE